MIENTALQEELDKRLKNLFRRPGLAENANMQNMLTSAAYLFCDMLPVQQEIYAKLPPEDELFCPDKPPMAVAAKKADTLETLLLREHGRRTNLTLLRLATETITRLTAFGGTLDVYREEYLVPVLKHHKVYYGPFDDKKVADYMVGSVIKAL